MRGKLKDLAKIYEKRFEDVHRGSTGEISRRTVTRTPVDTGLLQRSWTASKSDFDFTNRGGDFIAISMSLTLKDNYYFANGQPYVLPIEYLGHSDQATNGMMTPSVAEWQQIVDMQVRVVR